MKLLQNKSIVAVFFTASFIFSLLSVAVPGYFFISKQQEKFRKNAQFIHDEYMNLKKDMLKTEVNRAQNEVLYHLRFAEHTMQDDFESRLINFQKIFVNTCDELKKLHNPDSIITKASETFANVKFKKNENFFILHTSGRIVLLPQNTESNNQNAFECYPLYAGTIKTIIESAESFPKKGVFSWVMTKNPEETPDKILYYIKISQLSLVVGFYAEKQVFESEIQKIVLEHINNISFGKNGYIFASTWDGISLTKPAAGKNMIDTVDVNGKKIVQEMIQVSKKGSGFVEYVMPGIAGMKQAPKLSYVIGIPQWQWYIGAGIYIGDINELIYIKQDELQKEVQAAIKGTAALLVFFLFVSLLFGMYLYERMKKHTDIFENYFKTKNLSEKIDVQSLDILEFKEIAEFSNEMIDHRIKTESELQKIQKLESLGVLAGGIAHDFNNILTGILGNISLAEISNKDPEIQKYLEDAASAVSVAKNLSYQLLTFSKGGEPVRKSIQIFPVVKKACLLALSGTNVLFDIEEAKNLPFILGDENQLNQVFFNLTLNAVQAMPSGGCLTVRIQIYTDNTQNQEFVKITLNDNGPGIPEENLKKIFDPYFTTKSKGSGLGLSMVYSIISKHDGFISVSSSSGTGTIFEILLPVTTECEEKKTESAPQIKAVGTILVMDDEPVVLSTICSMIEVNGFTTVKAQNGEEAGALYQSLCKSGNTPVCVLLDLTIRGGKGGMETARYIKSIDPNARIIVMSGYSENSEMADYKEFGFCAAIKKPCSIRDIQNTIHSVLGC